MSRQRTAEKLAPWLVIMFFFLAWEFGVRAFGIDTFVLPKPTEVLTSMLNWSSQLQRHSLHTLSTTLSGFTISVVLGVILGIIVGYSRLAYHALYPLLIGFNSIPKVALVPVLVIWFGLGTVPAVLTASLISFFPILVNVATGIATVQPELVDVLRSLGAKKRHQFLKVGLPSAMPLFFGSLKIAITLAFVGSIISETVASNRGIGYLMISASGRFDVPLVFAGLCVVATMGVILYALFALLERRLTGWAYNTEN